jgi:hypothetical protein
VNCTMIMPSLSVNVMCSMISVESTHVAKAWVIVLALALTSTIGNTIDDHPLCRAFHTLSLGTGQLTFLVENREMYRVFPTIGVLTYRRWSDKRE